MNKILREITLNIFQRKNLEQDSRNGPSRWGVTDYPCNRYTTLEFMTMEELCQGLCNFAKFFLFRSTDKSNKNLGKNSMWQTFKFSQHRPESPFTAWELAFANKNRSYLFVLLLKIHFVNSCSGNQTEADTVLIIWLF